MVQIRVCELCGEEADIYCGADAAFLCFKCDARVHGANFLVMRHVRELVCGGCKEMNGNFVSGIGRFDNGSFLSICKSCSDISGCPTSCISSTVSKRMQARSKRAVMKKQRKRASFDFERWVRGLMGKWCWKMGVGDADVIASVGYRMFHATGGGGGKSPWELIAASFWVSLRWRRSASGERLRKLAEISRLGEKSILAGAAKIVAMLKDRDVEEGWGESC